MNRRFVARACAIAIAIAMTAPARAQLPPAGGADSLARPSDAEPGLPATEPLTIRQCMERARRAAPEVRAAGSDRSAARFDSIATSRNGRPAFSLIGGALVAPRGNYDPAITNYGEYHLQGRADWLLADGGARRLERQRSGIVLARAGSESHRAARDAAVAAAQAAVEMLHIDEVADIRRSTLDWVGRLLRRIQQGVRAGVHGRGDEQRVELAHDAVAAELLVLRETREVTRRELARQIAWPRATGPALEPPLESDDRAPTPADSAALFDALAGAPERRVADLDRAERNLDLEAAKRKNALEVTLGGDAGLHGADLTRVVPDDLRASHPNATLADRLHRDLGASVAIDLKRPVLDAAQGSSIEARRSAAGAADVRALAARLDRERFALDLLTHWRAAAARLDTARATVARAEQHVLRLESLYAGGGASLLELLDARQVLDDARGREADALAELRRARYEAEAQP